MWLGQKKPVISYMSIHLIFTIGRVYYKLAMACFPVALISSMDRALRQVITKIRVRFLVLDWIFSYPFSRLFFLLQRSCSLLCHYDSLLTVQNMIPFIISIFFQIIKVDVCYEIGFLKRCLSGKLPKVSAFSLSSKTPNMKVEISKSFAFTISTCKESHVW